jgi:predicted membrane chloride channel (bestrophin family)
MKRVIENTFSVPSIVINILLVVIYPDSYKRRKYKRPRRLWCRIKLVLRNDYIKQAQIQKHYVTNEA